MREGEEREALRGLREGSTEAFDRVYEAYRPRLFSFLARLSGDAALAEDLTQESFLRLARHARALDPRGRIGPWLFRVARNLLRDVRRRESLALDRLFDLRSFGGGLGWGSGGAGGAPRSPFEDLAADEDARDLEIALAALPEEQREAILLVAMEGLSPSEAAEVIGIKAEALRKRLSRGRRSLRAMLEES